MHPLKVRYLGLVQESEMSQNVQVEMYCAALYIIFLSETFRMLYPVEYLKADVFALVAVELYIYIYIPMAHNHSECLCMGCGGKTFLLPLHHRFVIVGQPSSILALGIHCVCRILL